MKKGADVLLCSSLLSHYETQSFVKTDFSNCGITFASAVPSIYSAKQNDTAQQVPHVLLISLTHLM